MSWGSLTDQKDLLVDLEKAIPLALIRDHTKTNDLITVTDEQLALYRASGVEAAQSYTGVWLGGKKWVTETTSRKRGKSGPRAYRLLWPASSGEVFVRYPGSDPVVERTSRGSRKVTLRATLPPLSWNVCCNPCASDSDDITLYYWTGAECGTFPSGIVVGVLKYIAYQISNPGSIGMTYTSDRAQNTIRSINNNALVASGALGEWKPFRSGPV